MYHCLFNMIRASCYIYCFSSVIDFSSERYIVSTGHRYSWYQQRRYSKDAKREARIRNSQWEQKFFSSGWKVFLNHFLKCCYSNSGGWGDPEKVHPPSGQLLEKPYKYESFCAKHFAGCSFPCEVVCCPYFPVRFQSQIIDGCGIMSFNSVICSPLTPGKLKKIQYQVYNSKNISGTSCKW